MTMKFEDYRVGDIVERTLTSGTTIRGEIYSKNGHHMWADSGAVVLVWESALEESRLVERPFKINTEPGTVYGHPTRVSYKVVRVDGAWLGRIPDIGYLWHSNQAVEKLVRNEGWVEMDFEGNPI